VYGYVVYGIWLPGVGKFSIILFKHCTATTRVASNNDDSDDISAFDKALVNASPIANCSLAAGVSPPDDDNRN
jgi:hypothetical protein